MKNKHCIVFSGLVFAAFFLNPAAGSAASILNDADGFAVLAGATATATGVVNNGSSTVTGSVGVSPGSAITGFPPATVSGGAIHAADAVAALAQTSVTKAYNGLAAMPYTSDLTGQDLGGLTLASGVYRYATSSQLTGTLKLDAQGFNNAYWVFQIGSTLTTASGAAVQVINTGSNHGFDDGVFWQVGTSATLGTTTAFEGNILADQSITLNTGATLLNGRALARNGAVTMDTNIISNLCPAPNNGPGFSGALFYDSLGKIVPIGPATVTPEPVSMVLFGLGAGVLGLTKLRRRGNKTAGHGAHKMKTCLTILVLSLVLIGSAQAAELTANVTADNALKFYLSSDNAAAGTLLGSSSDWKTPLTFASVALNTPGTYWLHAQASDSGYIAGFLGSFSLTGNAKFQNGTQALLTNTTDWSVSKTGWGSYETPTLSTGKGGTGYNDGTGPWGSTLSSSAIPSTAAWIWTRWGKDVGCETGDVTRFFTSKVTVTPEPVSMLLFGLGAGVLGLTKLRRKKK